MKKRPRKANVVRAKTKSSAGALRANGHIDINKIVSAERSAVPSSYGELFNKELSRDEMSSADRLILIKLRDVMLVNVSVNLHHQAFEPFHLPVGSQHFPTPDDYFRDSLDKIFESAKRVSNSVVKARLSHIVWFLEPAQRKAGFMALNAYIDILTRICRRQYSTEDGKRGRNFVILEALCSTFRVLSGLGYPKSQSSKFIVLINKFIRRFERDYDAIAFFGLIELMQCSPEFYSIITKNSIKRLIKRKDSNIPMHHKAYAYRLIAKTHRKNQDYADALSSTENAVNIYMSLFEECLNSERMIEALNWLDTAIYCYQDCHDRRYLELSKRRAEIKGSMRKRLAAIYPRKSKMKDDFSLEVDVSGITLSRALYEFTIVTDSPDPKRLLRQAKSIVKTSPVFSRLNNPSLRMSGTKAVLSSSTCSSDVDEYSIFGSQIHHIENIRRIVTARDEINSYRGIIGYERRVSKFDLVEIVGRSPVVSPCFVDTISDGFERYFKGDMIAAFYILMPFVESIIRKALIACEYDVTTYRSSTGVQEDRSISSLFNFMRNQVEGVFGSSIVTDIERVFLAQGGPLLRHRFAHADLDDGVPSDNNSIYALWLIWRLIALPLIPRWHEVISFEDKI